MFIQEVQLYAADNEVTVVQDPQDQASQTTGMTSMILNQTMNHITE